MCWHNIDKEELKYLDKECIGHEEEECGQGKTESSQL